MFSPKSSASQHTERGCFRNSQVLPWTVAGASILFLSVCFISRCVVFPGPSSGQHLSCLEPITHLSPTLSTVCGRAFLHSLPFTRRRGCSDEDLKTVTYRSSQIDEQKKLLSHETVKELSCFGVTSGSVRSCCPLNWKRFQSSCYFFSTTTLTWPSSLKNCSEMGAHLVVINTPEEQEFLFKTKPKRKEFYIGLTDQVVEGQWQWVDDTPFTESLRQLLGCWGA
ncbi:C-type lectin domain family 4 member E isoform X2 [Arvicola amphibius]|uniref:C-type lectin domain family 4 member E isoform X2 n=1 Tax=Arvicola amphibius TaxID=1047088 RepID=UPI0018E3F629|nr:C-type lectin domain family 4 member E isoform X2 [Arvicola amphibius]